MKNKCSRKNAVSRAVTIAVGAAGLTLISTSALPQGELPKYQILDIGALGGHESTAVDINDRGEVTGEAERPDGSRHAFVYKDGSLADLGTLQTDRYGAGSSNGADINNRGEVVGQSLTQDGSTHAVLYSNGAVTDLGTLGGISSNGYALNETGQVTGISFPPGNNEYHAFL
jgi:chitinase